jgi:hypothetical protein
MDTKTCGFWKKLILHCISLYGKLCAYLAGLLGFLGNFVQTNLLHVFLEIRLQWFQTLIDAAQQGVHQSKV